MPSDRQRIRRIRHHEVPAWWRDAKLGIFVHWTPASVAAFAPVDVEIGELMARNEPHAMAWSPYAEWYENSMRFPESPAARHHAEVWGDRPYRQFAADWEAALATWDPGEWAARFAATGARYVVLVTKHHDGYCLWPTDVPNPHQPGFHSSRDVVGELAEAVRGVGLRFGVYYSGGLDWTFNEHPIGTFSDLLAAQPRGDYIDYAEAQVQELVDRYRPSVLWNDISWPAPAARLATMLESYYRAVPDGVVNDRFMPWSPAWELARTPPARRLLDRLAARSAAADKGIVPPKPPMFDVRTPEYTVFDSVQPTPWECVRGIDRSFGHNEASGEELFLGRAELVWSLADIVAKGGNLLLNVGPRGVDATIAEAQTRRLDWLASFTAAAGEALFATRPWVHPSGAITSMPGSAGGPVVAEVRYTARDTTVFALIRRVGAAGGVAADTGDGSGAGVCLTEVDATPTTRVTDLDGEALRFVADSSGLTVWLPGPLSVDEPTVVVLRDVRARALG
ncbi:MAG: alpha-L-fucosidase [Acidimicrobiales bacterium]